MEGFERGRNLDKIGMDAQDTAELSFNDVRVPSANLLEKVGKGFFYLMQNLPQERLSIALNVGRCDGVSVGDDVGIHQAAQGFWSSSRQLPEQPLRARRVGDGINFRADRD